MYLSANHVFHHYGSLPVLEDVSLRVEPGEIVAIVGPSGSGKSTLLRMLGGLERPDAGNILLGGDAPADTLNPITFVFQDFALLPWRSVAGNVALPLEAKAVSASKRAEIIADVLSRTGLSDFADAFPKQLSGGMKQRVAIARALAMRPAILLMDEPLSALDAQTRELLLDDLVRLVETERFAGVYVTHNLAEAVRLGTRIMVLSRRPGRVRQVIPIDIPLPERRADHPEMIRIQQELWTLLRDEAREAEREVAHG